MPRLDGIRALAVAGVLLTHFFNSPLVHTLQTGRFGVRVFFVLSGFLITRILLEYRERMSVAEAARAFYWRRFLRLVPPYYFAIFVALCLGIMNMRQDWPWHALYLSSQLFKSRWTGAPEPAGHLWSLSVEEQFYILWFAVAVWMPKRWFIPAVCACFMISAASRIGTHYIYGQPASDFLNSIDFLALGALLGWASLKKRALFEAFAGPWPLALSGLILAWMMLLHPIPVLVQPLMGIFGAALIARAATPETRALDWLSVGPLSYLGKISYGIYLYHWFLPPIVGLVGVGIQNDSARGVALSILTVGVAALSWEFLEKPALRFKDRSPLKAWRTLKA